MAFWIFRSRATSLVFQIYTRWTSCMCEIDGSTCNSDLCHIEWGKRWQKVFSMQPNRKLKRCAETSAVKWRWGSRHKFCPQLVSRLLCRSVLLRLGVTVGRQYEVQQLDYPPGILASQPLGVLQVGAFSSRYRKRICVSFWSCIMVHNGSYMFLYVVFNEIIYGIIYCVSPGFGDVPPHQAISFLEVFSGYLHHF